VEFFSGLLTRSISCGAKRRQLHALLGNTAISRVFKV
jgi:hypothetical protein